MQKLESSNKEQFSTASGDYITVTDSVDGKLVELGVKGNSFQQSYSGKNLLNATLDTVTQNGVTCTNNGDGTYTLNGTATADFLEHSDKLPIPTEAKNKTLIFYDGLPDVLRGYAGVRFFDAKGEFVGELNKTVHKMEMSKVTHYDFVIFSMAGAVNDNILLKPILTTDPNATYDDFEPYVGGIPAPNPSYPQEIKSVGDDGSLVVKSRGKNMIPFP